MVALVISTDYLKSVRNGCVREHFDGVFVLSLCLFICGSTGFFVIIHLYLVKSFPFSLTHVFLLFKSSKVPLFPETELNDLHHNTCT